MTEPKGLRGKDKQQDALTDADGGQGKLPEGVQRDPKGVAGKGGKRSEPASHFPLKRGD